MSLQPSIFYDGKDVHYADTCEPLSSAVEAGKCRLKALVHGTYPGEQLPAKVVKEVCSVGYWDAPTDQDWGLDMHRNEGVELTFLEQGRVSFFVGDKKYRLNPGDLTITRPWQPHKVGDPNVNACQLHWLILDVGVRHPHNPWTWPDWLILSPDDLKELTACLRGNEQHVWKPGTQIGNSFRALRDIVDRKDKDVPETRLKLHMNDLLINLHEMFKRSKPDLDESLSSARRTVEMFLEELPRNLEEDWTLDTMAERCGLARSRFSHYCRQITNRTPLVFHSECRLRAAKEMLLEHPDWKITYISRKCGFYSNQYFSAFFRKHMKMTPVEFREREKT